MSKQTHIEALKSRHQNLEDELKQAAQASSIDNVRLTELKRRKLALKDKIERLRSLH